jgi:diguanylate cyclase (GGDEF)-like protein
LSTAKTENLSESIDWKLTEFLFNQKAILIVGGLGPMIVAAFVLFRTGQSWLIGWGAAALLVLMSRLGVNAAFPRRRVRSGRPTVWRRRFLVGTWANGAICGICGAGSVLSTDAFTQMLVITMLTAFVMGSAARNGVYPKAAVGSVLLAEVPLLLACLATRDLYYWLYMPCIVIFTLSAMGVVRHLYIQAVHLLVTDEENALLVSEVSRSNRELAAANESLAAANKKLAAIAGTDGLTGVPNRRTFDESFEMEVCSAQRTAASDPSTIADLALLMIDIDWFKGYNDRYGHQAGDKCLRHVAQILAFGCSRPRDVLARYGGEEFVAILPHTDLNGATAVAEGLRGAVEALGLEHAASAFGVVTVSVGVAICSGDKTATPADLFRRADEALYIAKHAGRNRVQKAQQPKPLSATESV